MPPGRTRTTETLGVADDAEFGSAAQRERRKRILDATLALASKGGYDAVQMRTVAERADVALGTLYRYFPSKIHLLVSALTLEFERTQEKLDRKPIPGETPYDRMLYVLSRVTRSMQREPMLTEAMTRAFMFADPSAAAEVNTVARQMERMFTRAMHDGPPTADDVAIARVIASVSSGSRCMVLVTRDSTYSMRSYGVSPGIGLRSSFSWVRSNSSTSADTSRWILEGKYR